MIPWEPQRRLRRLSTRASVLQDVCIGPRDINLRPASAVLAGQAFISKKDQIDFISSVDLVRSLTQWTSLQRAWTKRRLRRLRGCRHTDSSRLLLANFRLLNVSGVMWPRRPGFFLGKSFSIILPSHSVRTRFRLMPFEPDGAPGIKSPLRSL
ncbi:hypothetical protein BDZ89DRAFT_81267 [Hymenopellis radicata]|nr:hypothetical protein BDZ89DRAFT_81267 [Hymenopellis radicata]